MKELIVYSNVIHSFSRPIAKKYGVNAALVLGYIGFRMGLSNNERDGKYWLYDTLDTIAEHYPYLGRSAIYEAIKRLTAKNGPLIVGHYNKRKGDRTNWYAFRDEDTETLLKKKPLYFKVDQATFHGIPAAVLLNNLAYHIKKERRELPNYRFQPLSSSSLASVLPFSRSTIQRALKLLVDEGVLIWRTTADTTQPTDYCFANMADLDEYLAGSNPNSSVLDELPENMEVMKIQPAPARIQQMGGSEANKPGANPNEAGSKANDVTTLIDLFGNDCLKETVEKNDSASPSSFFPTHTLSNHSHEGNLAQ
jgi:hypothetical protein